jgi:uncharacterized protein (DUF1499 family)
MVGVDLMTIMKWLLLAGLALGLLAVAAGQLGLLRGQAPGDLGVNGGKLKAPSVTPNSVSSQADLWPGHPQQAYAGIAPLALVGDGAATLARLATLVRATPGAQIVSERSDYLYAIFTTRLMQYTDDVEFWFDPTAGVVQVRSASRLGRSDLGANRARVERLRTQLLGR